MMAKLLLGLQEILEPGSIISGSISSWAEGLEKSLPEVLDSSLHSNVHFLGLMGQSLTL